MPSFDAEVVVRDRNQLTLPSAIVDARKITPGMRFVVHIDDEHPDVIVLRKIPKTYAGKLKACTESRPTMSWHTSAASVIGALECHQA